MKNTQTLIDQLSASAVPVKPLASPIKRTFVWCIAAIIIIGLIVTSYGVRPGFFNDIHEPVKAIGWGASILTGLLAAFAVFQISVPGRSSAWTWLSAPFALLWFSSLCLGCMQDFGTNGMDAFAFEAGSWECARAITAMSLPLGFIMLMLVRHAGVIRPALTAYLAALSTAALASAGVSLFHNGESAFMVLIWHLGAVVVLSVACWISGRQLFGWMGLAKT
ncbi:MAG: DUF1109 domain-containing protein [Arenimonas sp.]